MPVVVNAGGCALLLLNFCCTESTLKVPETAERPHTPDGLRSLRAEANARINKLLPGQRD